MATSLQAGMAVIPRSAFLQVHHSRLRAHFYKLIHCVVCNVDGFDCVVWNVDGMLGTEATSYDFL